jgi:hypothetical protein
MGEVNNVVTVFTTVVPITEVVSVCIDDDDDVPVNGIDDVAVCADGWFVNVADETDAVIVLVAALLTIWVVSICAAEDI